MPVAECGYVPFFADVFFIYSCILLFFRLKGKFPSCVHIWKESVLKSQLYYLNLKQNFAHVLKDISLDGPHAAREPYVVQTCTVHPSANPSPDSRRRKCKRN
jgi:hypothetical protein